MIYVIDLIDLYYYILKKYSEQKKGFYMLPIISPSDIRKRVLKHQKNLIEAKEHATYLMENKNSIVVSITAGIDKNLGYGLISDIRVLELFLLERITHRSWESYFHDISLINIIGDDDKYHEAISRYMFKNIRGDEYYRGVRALLPFTEENIEKFKLEYLSINELKFKKTIQDFLKNCGHPSAPTAYRKHLMLRSLKKTNETKTKSLFSKTQVNLLCDLIAAIAYYRNDKNLTIRGEVRQNIQTNLIGDATINLYSGFSVQLRPNLNANIILSLENVDLLNKELKKIIE